MTNTTFPENFLAATNNTVDSLTETLTTETQKFLETTTASTGKTLKWIASNPILKAADNTIGLDWLMTFLGKIDVTQVEETVAKMRSQYPDETPSQIAHRLIVQKAWMGGRLGLVTNIIPPIAALFLGVELIATTRLQTEMVYEIAAAYGLDLSNPSRRGEVLAIFGLSLGADLVKSGLSIVEVIPGIGAVVGASTNAAMLYVLGRTACRFYERKTLYQEVASMQQETDADWQVAFNQSKIMDRVLIHMVQTSYPQQGWKAILPTINKISPSSVKTVALNLEQPQNLSALLEKLLPEFAPLTLNRCYEIAKSNGEVTLEEQEILSQIAIKFDLELSALDK
ncbi:uncharacterized protein associated with GTPases [Xenococcus sp. PCC 7305]|uniref:hypothetical protein n=1 Tax=Xenococcus sp. PCC 7305 TaxID=102125 RepID=UPI0002AC1BB2|nr:hypothetical protein [Xenococcus sp. PCC 7305]ELS04133.1 uncharacterized protein associated with GTPases [Xenococcus sp. PCC 7305]